MATLEKAKLMNVDKGTSQDVLFNPKEYSVEKSVQWEPHKAPGLDTPEQQFTSGNPAILSVELFFDTYEAKTDVRTEHTDKIMQLTLIDVEKHRPPLVIFAWGTFTFKGVIESLTLRYTMFLPNGKPCRATASLSIKEAKTASEQSNDSEKESPDHTKRRTLKHGDKLGRVKVCFPRLPGKPESDWVRVAQPAAGAGRGFYWIPHVNDEVLIAFERGEAHRPYVIGSLWNGKDKPMKTAYEDEN